MRFFPFYLLALSLTLGSRQAAADPECDRRFGGLSAGTETRYAQFENRVREAYAVFRSLTMAERASVYQLSSGYAGAVRKGDFSPLRKYLAADPSLTDQERHHVEEVLHLSARSPAEGLEAFRANLEYLFWTDHSARHAREVLAVSRALRADAPPAFRSYFHDVLESAQSWAEIEHAIRLHDSRMATSRVAHAEAVLGAGDDEFPASWPERQRRLNSVLAMLHSKSTVPYDRLAQWPEVLKAEILPHVLAGGFVTPDRAREIERAVSSLTPEEVARMARQAAWLRVVDANRPIGASLRNSLGQSFSLDPDGKRMWLNTPDGMVPVIPSQAANYGELAIENLSLTETASGQLVGTFHLRLPEPLHSQVRAELDQIPFAAAFAGGGGRAALPLEHLSEPARKIANSIAGVVGDYPPDLLKGMKIVVE